MNSDERIIATIVAVCLVILIIIGTIFIAYSVQVFDKIDDNKIVLLSSVERKPLNDSMQYESVTDQHDENV